MKKLFFTIILLAVSMLTFSQAMESVKVVIINDSIVQMGKTNGRMQMLIPAPIVGRSIIVQSIDVRNKVIDRLYSPIASQANYKIGYVKGSHWYDVTTFSFDNLNARGNTTFFYNSQIESRLWDDTQTDNAPLMIKFDTPMDFTTGSNRLTLYITYRILN